MFRTLGFLLLIFILTIIFVAPVRNYMNSLFHGDRGKVREEQIIGTVSDYNPRVQEIQEILEDAGFESGPRDGIMGAQTRAAIRKFQKERSLKPTGKIDEDTQLALNREKEIIKSSPEVEINSSLDRSTPSIIKDEHLEMDKEDTSKKIKAQDEVLSYRLKSKDRVKKIQMALKKIGFYKGEIDGKIGPQTKRAIKAFQKSKGLNPDGVVGPKTWEELNKYLGP